MITNFNDILRDEVTQKFNVDPEYGTFEVMDFFNSITTEEKANLLRLALADFYKINYYFDNKPHSIFKLKTSDIIDFCIVNGSGFIDVLKSIKIFHEMDYVTKCLILERLEIENQDNNINSIYKMHKLDKLTYQIVDDLENYKEYYKNYLEVNKESARRIKTISDFICIRVCELKKVDSAKYKKFILEFIKVYYKWKNFIKNHEGKYILNGWDIKYLNTIEIASLEQLFVIIEKNHEFLFTLVSEYLHYTTSKLEIKEEIIDNYFITECSDEVKEKLMIK